jgi:hypothetical protein
VAHAGASVLVATGRRQRPPTSVHNDSQAAALNPRASALASMARADIQAAMGVHLDISPRATSQGKPHHLAKGHVPFQGATIVTAHHHAESAGPFA